jgi:hypothetical protein
MIGENYFLGRPQHQHPALARPMEEQALDLQNFGPLFPVPQRPVTRILENHTAARYQRTPHVCNDCGTSFTRPTDLNRHMRTIHEYSELWCPVAGCKRNVNHFVPEESKGKRGYGAFKRMDKLRSHIRNSHPDYTGNSVTSDLQMAVSANLNLSESTIDDAWLDETVENVFSFE